MSSPCPPPNPPYSLHVRKISTCHNARFMNRYQNRNHLRPWRSLFPALDVGHVCLVWVIIGFFPDFSSFWLVVVITLVMMFWYSVVKYSSIKTTYSIHEIVSCQIHITVLLSSFQSQGLKVAQNLSRPSPSPPSPPSPHFPDPLFKWVLYVHTLIVSLCSIRTWYHNWKTKCLWPRRAALSWPWR